MHPILEDYLESLNSLSRYVSYMSSLRALTSKEIEGRIVSRHARKINEIRLLMPGVVQLRKFDYCSIVISLYGFFERFIEDVISLIVKEYCACSNSFGDLPQAIQDNNLPFTLDFLSNKYNNAATEDAGKVVEGLSNCFNGSSAFLILDKAFNSHNTNFWVKTVRDFFGRVGVVNFEDKILRVPAMLDYLAYKYPDLDATGSKDQFKEVFDYIDELARRRNDVAHGNVSDIIKIEIIGSEWILFFEFYAIAVFELVASELVRHISTKFGVDCGKPIAVHNSNIVCFEPLNQALSLGDFLVAVPSNENGIWSVSAIESIEINGQGLDEIPDNNHERFAVKVNGRHKQVQNHYLIKKEKIIEWLVP